MNHPAARLVSPSIKYQASFLAAVDEFLPEHLEYYANLSKYELTTNFAGYVQRLLYQAQGLQLPPGYVAHSELWLIDGEEFIGRLDIRHSLNEHLLNIGGHIGYDIRPSKRRQGYGKLILKLGLGAAKKLGIQRVLLTCDETNQGSRKIIESQAGEFEDLRPVGPGKPRKRRYWIAN